MVKLRTRTALVAAAVFGAAALTGTGIALAEGCESGGPDFNGDGCADLAVSDPNATVSGQQQAGRVTVVYGGDVAPALVHQGQAGVNGTPETNDRFGSVIRAARINNDNYYDLVVSAPGESVGDVAGAGIIHVVFGSADGLGAGAAGVTLRQGLHGIPGKPEPGDGFGFALSVNTTNVWEGTTEPVVAFGAPGEDIGSARDAGTAGVVTFDYTTGEVASAAAIDQNSAGIANTAEAGDGFGAAVDVFQGPGGFSCPVDGVKGLTLAIGAPGEDLSGVPDAGMVHLVRNLAEDTPLNQNSPGVDGTTEAGDQFGHSVAVHSECEHDGPSHVSMAVGVPGEDIGDVADAGMMHLFRSDDDELPLPQRYSVNQGTDGVIGSVEAGDRFGTYVALAGPYRGDDIGEPVLVNSPGEDVGDAADAGALYVFGDNTDTPGDSDIRITDPDIAEPAEKDDHFGTVIASNTKYLYVGAPDDARYPSGVVHGLVWEDLLGDGAERRLLVPGSDGIPTGASRFGAGLA